MLAVGDVVRIGAAGVQRFAVAEVVDDDTVMIQSVDDAPGVYPWRARVADLVPADSAPAAGGE